MSIEASPNPTIPAARPPEPIHAAAMMPGSEPFLGPANRGVAFIAIGLGLVVLLAIATAVGLLKIRIPPFWILTAVATVVLSAIAVWIWFVVRNQAKPFRWSKNGSFSDSSFRLRLVGEGAITEAVLGEVTQDSFEPVVLRSLSAVTFASFLPTAEQLAGAAKLAGKQRFTGWGFETRSNAAAKWETGIVIAACAGLIVGLHLQVFGTWSGISAPHFFGAIGLASVIRAFIRPEYIRIAPGVLDVLRYPFLGFGPPRFERFDLRTATVAIDLSTGAARIHDPSRPTFPVAYISVRSVLAKPATTAAALLSAARTQVETPPLPTDALVG